MDKTIQVCRIIGSQSVTFEKLLLFKKIELRTCTKSNSWSGTLGEWILFSLHILVTYFILQLKLFVFEITSQVVN